MRNNQTATHDSRITNHESRALCLVPFSLCLALAVAGCGTAQPYVYEDNYLTYHHPFTDAAAEAVRKNAEKDCAERKQDAVKTRSVCSMKECTTHYQCVEKN